MSSRGSRRARLVALERADPPLELGTVGALLESGAPEGAVVVAALAGDAAGLGRYQLPGRTGLAREVRRLTGGRSTQYGDGILALSAVVPTPGAWLDEVAELRGPRLLNRYVRGLLSGLRRSGVDTVYPGRDFVTAGGRRVAHVALERTSSGALLFQAVVAVARSYPTDEPEPSFPGLPPSPEPSWLEREARDVPSPSALAESYAEHFSLELFEASIPEPLAAPTLELALPSHSGDAVPIPIGWLQAHVALDTDGTLARVAVTGDWIAASADVVVLEELLAGQPPERELLTRLIDRWLALPGNTTIGLVDAHPLAEAVCSAAARASSRR